jgi:hypothetical protein
VVVVVVLVVAVGGGWGGGGTNTLYAHAMNVFDGTFNPLYCAATAVHTVKFCQNLSKKIARY